MTLRCLQVFIAVFLVSTQGRAEVRCAEIFGSHMVVQQGQPIVFWGTAAPSESIRINFGDEEKTTSADAAGKWRVELAARTATANSESVTITGAENTIRFEDVVVGEVWFCSGQSNMEKPLGPRKGQKPTDDYEAELTRADCPALRIFQVPHSGKAKAGSAASSWWKCDATSLTNTQFSALAYYFGRELTRKLGVSVGLIHSSYGGTRIEAWMPHAAFAENSELGGLEAQRYDAYVPGVQATELYESMVKPYVPFRLRGFLWYQGEANCMNADGASYATKQRVLITSWRSAWDEAEAPFYFALIAPFAYSHQHHWAKQLTPEALPALWDAQLATLDLPRTAIVTTTDLAGNGRDIHPTNKRDVGQRFARIALAETYGRPRSEADDAHAPLFAGVRKVEMAAKLEVNFAHASGLRARDDAALTEFEVAGSDRKFFPAKAEIIDGKVLVSCESVARPEAVRFAWSELANPNLVNAAGLPALPFRSDNWPVILETRRTQ